MATQAIPHPLPPPPPVYIRSSPPPPPDLPPPPPPHARSSSTSKPSALHRISRKPISMLPGQVGHDVMQILPQSSLKKDDLPELPSSRGGAPTKPPSFPFSSSRPSLDRGLAEISLSEPTDSGVDPWSGNGKEEEQAFSRRDDIPPIQLPEAFPYRDTSADSDAWSLIDPNDREGGRSKENLNPTADPENPNPRYNQSNSSRGSLDSVTPTTDYQPLHYHHLPLLDALSRRMGANRSSSTEYQAGSNNHLAPYRAMYGSSSVLRPSSSYSSVSDSAGRGRTQSPQYSPGMHARSPSTHSASPDVRPLSFVDLLNTPYPQPPPAPTSLSNTHLRSSIGNNVSLLSHKQTFEMYLANVKKTNDPAVQYEFAVFMINAIQETGPGELGNGGSSTSTEKDPDITRALLLREARSILQRLSDRGYPHAQYYLADGYASGLFNKGREDHERAFSLFIAASKHGHAEAGYRAALCYEFGWGSRVDAAKAVQFYRQAASKNHPGAMLRLGRACLAGDMGLGKRYREGVKWLKRAAEAADPQYNSAPYELGVLHETGFGDDVFPDPSYAAQLFTKSAELGHAEANYRLGDAYEHGKLNCPRDPALSIHFYTGAATAGHALAMMALCAWYLVGAEPVLERDENEAYAWAKQAAELGLAKAQYAVGYFTEMGIGCRRDALEANVWYVKSADQGDERAIHRLAAINAAAEGADPIQAGKAKPNHKGPLDGENHSKPKRFGLF